MPEISLIVPPEIGFSEEHLKNYLLRENHLTPGQYSQIVRRSVDARQKAIKINLKVEIRNTPFEVEYSEYFRKEHNVTDCPQVVIVGAGPAGLFAAMKAIENGLKPIVLERGKDVRSRRRDLAAINKDHIVNPDSNYCFGEGGAGTYSDGKLYTRSKKRGSVRRVFEILVSHGADPQILFEAHPHIGTNKLPKIITAIRETIEHAGGEIRFDSCVTDFMLKKGEIKGVILRGGELVEGVATLLATGHSARDIFQLCKKREIKIEAKPFALGVRVEHSQQLIDQIQYHCSQRGEYLPPSPYSLVSQTQINQLERGVFSFCMCPGGFVVPAATSQEEVVVNGMSPSRRDGYFANSGIVVAIEREDLHAFSNHEELAHMHFQSQVENKAWIAGGKTQRAPAQRLMDFLDNRISANLPRTSYQPGLVSADMRSVLPDDIYQRLIQGFRHFGKKMKGYLTNEAQVIGVESRTSSPVKIPRDISTFEHVELKRLFPCGEGAGYAGGIASAAIDGEKCMEQIVNLYGKK
ncbi:MAG: NAD(P)/FAD-dependent oxidoreductase [Cyclobacteriaceae bacterium]